VTPIVKTINVLTPSPFKNLPLEKYPGFVVILFPTTLPKGRTQLQGRGYKYVLPHTCYLPISLPDQLLVPARPARFARNCGVGAWPFSLFGGGGFVFDCLLRVCLV
jgi:hypothetical protein